MSLWISFLFLVWVSALCIGLYGTFLRLRHRKEQPPYLDAPFALYPISVLKPLKGADEGLQRNLETFFELDYPEFELVFSVADEKDPACEIVKRLIRANPSVPARLIIGAVEVGTNPKVNNLVKSYDSAKYDWLLISDSNVRVPRNYLRRLVGHADCGTGVITSVVAGQNAKGWGGQLEAMYLNTFYSRGMHVADALGRPCVIGKSMLFRRSAAERFGGIRTLAKYLAEDYMAGEAMRWLGLNVVIAADPIDQHIGQYSFRDFWSRHVRWGRIRKAQAPGPFIVEPLLGSVISGICGAICFYKLLDFSPLIFLTLHFTIWLLQDLMMIESMGVETRLEMLGTWIARECLSIPLWLHVASGNSVNWRGKRLVIKPGGIVEFPENAYF